MVRSPKPQTVKNSCLAVCSTSPPPPTFCVPPLSLTLCIVTQNIKRLAFLYAPVQNPFWSSQSSRSLMSLCAHHKHTHTRIRRHIHKEAIASAHRFARHMQAGSWLVSYTHQPRQHIAWHHREISTSHQPEPLSCHID